MMSRPIRKVPAALLPSRREQLLATKLETALSLIEEALEVIWQAEEDFASVGGYNSEEARFYREAGERIDWAKKKVQSMPTR